MDPMRAMPHLPTHAPSSRTHFRPFLNGKELPPSFDNPLLAFQSVNISVNPKLRVVSEECQVLGGEIWVRAYFKSQRG